MLVGHIAAGFIGNRLAPRTSLGTVVMASLAADLLWGALLLAGIELVEFRAGHTTQDSLLASQISFSHSLVMDALWASVFAAMYFAIRNRRRGAWVLFAAVLSHWLLDFVSHRPDMPLVPGVHAYFGLRLWDSVAATIVVEGGLWMVAVLIYVRTTSPRRAAGAMAFWGGVLLFTAVWWNNVAGPPPPANVRGLGFSSLLFFGLVTAWAYWIDRLRAAVR